MPTSAQDYTYEVVEIDEFEVMATTMLYAFVAPVAAMAIEQLIFEPWLIEEIVKAVVVMRASQLEEKYVKTAFLAGLVFGISETILYIVNVSMLGQLDPIGWRLIFTVPMHAATALVFAYFSKGKGWWMVIGLSLSMAIHGIFNAVVGV